MKVLRISLCNIASLAGAHTVDFTQEPLRSAGLFAICGPTGSGKSTLLDALCLALYENTPRLAAVRGGVRLEDGSGDISQRDPGNLLRRGTAEGFAEAAFVGVDGGTYTARWNVRRARKRASGALQPTEMTLFRGNIPAGGEGPVEQGGKKTEVLAAIEAKVGLSFGQLTRAVLLAQNDFATFLKADDRERAEILQALTGTQRFEAISMAVFARWTQAQAAAVEIERILTLDAPLPPAERVAAESGLAAAEGEARAATDRVALREADAAWLARRNELGRAAREAELALERARQMRIEALPRRATLDQTEEISGAARPLREAERRLALEVASAEQARRVAAAAEARALAELERRREAQAASVTGLAAAKTALEQAQRALREARDLDSRLPSRRERHAETIRERAMAERHREEAVGQRDAALREQQAAEKERAELAPRRAALAPIAFLAKDAAAWLDRLDRASSARDALAAARWEWERRAGAEQRKREAMAAESAREPALRAAAEAAASAYDRAEAAARELGGEKIARARREAEAARAALQALERNLRDIQALAEQSEQLRAETAEVQSQNEKDGRSRARLSREIPTAKAALESARRSSELAQAAVDDAAIALRESLSPELPCPVCGATDHPYAAHPPGLESAALRALKDDCTRKEAEHVKLVAEEASLAKVIEARRVEITAKAKAAAGLAPRLEAARLIRHEHAEAAAVLARPDEERAAVLAARLSASEEAVAAADAADGSRRAAEKAREASRTARDDARQAWAALEKRLSEWATELAEAKAAREGAEKARDQGEAALGLGRAELAPLFAAVDGLEPLWEADAVAARKRFAEAAAEHTALEQRVVEIETRLREHAARLGPAQEGVARTETAVAAKKQDEAKAQAELRELEAKRAEILEGRGADLVEDELNKAVREAGETHELRAREFVTADKLFTGAREILKTADGALAALRERELTAVAAVTAWLRWHEMGSGQALDRPALDAILGRSDEWIKGERAALAAIEGGVHTAEGALAAHRGALEQHLAAQPTAEEEAVVVADLAAARAAKLASEERREAARAVLLADEQRRAKSAELALELEARRRAAQPWERLNDLIGSKDGAKFRNIAQRRTLDILLGYANRQLDLLASRYRLERISESLNLIVLDRDMGDERRSVHTLSGGESFLVSLALALGLASLTSNRLRIESLFIDEGFGSLDPETLAVAMGALMRLEAQGRKVGVISHVAEMAEAIPVQIRVEKGRSGASRLSGSGVGGRFEI